MSHDPHSHTASTSAAAATTWTEPPWSGWIETTGDALLILEAARRGLIPRVTRRLVDSERKMITSGSVFVFDEDESGIKRWTDGFFWSPSRILGNFLLYRETEKRGAGHRSARAEQPEASEPAQFASTEGIKVEGQTLSRPKSESSKLNIDRQRERSLVGSLTNSYKFKQGGMMKKTFSLTIGGVAQHLISYYKIEDVEQGRLRSPSTLPELASLDISPEYLDKTHFRNPPKVEIGVDGIPRYRGEADDIEGSPQLLPTPLSGMPLYQEPEAGSNKRSKRYDPYSGNAPKRSRKSKNATATQEPAVELPPMQQPQPGYPEVGAAPTMPPYAPYSYHYQMAPGYHVPPPIYSPGPYGGAAATTSSPLPQHTPSPPAAYPSYGMGQPEQSSNQYPYYAPPHGYAAYPGVAWPHYSGYPPQPVHAQAAAGSSAEHPIARLRGDECDDQDLDGSGA
ncbi:Gti1/Pac2 family-domain-containing protein [Amylocystis lapponica]|nr:Gti1/Pac2 family-domain-containing protein [Amylocystis lapponica]